MSDDDKYFSDDVEFLRTAGRVKEALKPVALTGIKGITCLKSDCQAVKLYSIPER
jgi:hypothetical protein